MTIILRKTPGLPSDQSDKLARPPRHPPAPRGGVSVARGAATSRTSLSCLLFFMPRLKAGAAGCALSQDGAALALAPVAGRAQLPAPTRAPRPRRPRDRWLLRGDAAASLWSRLAARAPPARPCKRALPSPASDDGAQSEPGLWGSADSSLGSISWGPRALCHRQPREPGVGRECSHGCSTGTSCLHGPAGLPRPASAVCVQTTTQPS